MNTLERIFSEENMLAYSNACLELALDMPELRETKGFDTLVIPSRGAVPLFLGMVYALEKLRDCSEVHKEFYENLGVQPMLTPLLPECSKIANSVVGKDFRVLIIPFTADLNIEKFDSETSNDEYTRKTREYWANVSAAFFKSQNNRNQDPYFRSFVDVILRDIECRDYLAKIYEVFPQIKSFAILDTVVSGRASNDILKAFDSIAEKESNPNLMPKAFLVVDGNGTRLKPTYSAYLSKKVRDEQACRYSVPRIVSEDEGVSLLGVSAVIYPSVMRASKKLELNGREFFVGAGGWYLGSDLENVDSAHHETFRRFMNLVYRGIDVKWDGRGYLEEFKKERENFLIHFGKNSSSRQEDLDSKSLMLKRRYKPARWYETSSHVVHISFSESATREISSKLLGLPGVSYKK
ncbi:MAG: hypothetical protein QXF25_00210 [Candidatus Pacearchaeota archaeon]